MQGTSYNVDLVMCIDCTGSMAGILSTVKKNALKFHSDLQETLKEKGKVVSELRVKVVGFRDIFFDEEKALTISDFMELPDQQDEFSELVSSFYPSGGGDGPESGLEALSIAIDSDWNKAGTKRRELIVVWTDAPAHPLEKRSTANLDNCPATIPTNFDDLSDWWAGQDKVSGSAKRLILFAPDEFPWSDIANYWENTAHFPSKAGGGLEEVTYNEILSVIEKSI